MKMINLMDMKISMTKTDDMPGIIYLITNMVNRKVYVGQTRSTLKKRWSQHKSDANTSRDNMIIHRAMKKHGFENFKIETLFYCNLIHLDEYETIMVNKYMSTDRNFGYNTSKGGRGACHKKWTLTEEHRIKLSSRHSETGIPNIVTIKNPNSKEIIGYRVARIQDGQVYAKTFRHSKYSLEENLEFAKQWLKNFKAGIVDNSKMNKLDQLPKHIYYYKHKKTKEIIGYIVKFNSGTFIREKSFTSSEYSMECKLEMAIKERDKILNLRKNDKTN